MTFSGIIDAIDGWLWGLPLIIILLATHIYCTVRSGFIQRYIGRGIKLSVTPDPDGEDEPAAREPQSNGYDRSKYDFTSEDIQI